MKLKVINFDSKNVFGSIKQAVFTSALSYAKMYELLHKQIWRKAPYRISTYGAGTINNRPITYIRSWKLNSPSKSPYIYDGGDHTFGLNQFFVGQDYRKEYQGDPKDGIYHDTCSIFPRDISTSASSWGYKTVWILTEYDDNGLYYNYGYSWIGQDDDGNILIDNVELIKYTTTVNNITTKYKKIVVYYHNGTTSEYELGSYSDIDYSDILCTNTSYPPFGNNFGFSAWYKFGEDMSAHGAIVSQVEYVTPQILAFNFTRDGWIRTYEDGTVIEFTPLADSGESGQSYYPTYRILPMMYTDTGDLTMDRIEFVDKWDEYFELIVAEDSEWWTGLIKPVSLIIAAVIIYLSWGSLSSPIAKAIVLIGYVVYAAGVITNNTDLMLIGGIMMAGVSIYTAVEAATTTTAATSAQLSTMSTEQALATTSFSETFSGYASAAGMENLLVMPTVESYTSLTLEGLATSTVPYAELGAQAGMSVADYVSLSGANAFSIDSLMSIGKELYSAYNNTNQLLKKNTTSSSKTSDTSDDSGVRITIKSSDEEDDVMQYIKKVIDIL